MVELRSAHRVANALGVAAHEVVEFDLRIFGGSALTDNIPVPEDRPPEEMGKGIPVTYVPARNTIFLAFALAWCETLKAQDIFAGMNVVDYSGYPDCRPEYMEAYRRLMDVATREGVEGRQHMTIHTPLIHLTKKQILLAGSRLGVDYGLTHSCYQPVGEAACGHCDSCLIRRKGFDEAGLPDPTVYAEGALA